MDGLEILDKDGNALDIADVVAHFILSKAKLLKLDAEDIAVSIDTRSKYICIQTLEPNGYDGTEVIVHDEATKYNNL